MPGRQAKSRFLILLAVIVLAGAIFAAIWSGFKPPKDPLVDSNLVTSTAIVSAAVSNVSTDTASRNQPRVVIGKIIIPVEVAQTDADIKKGLSGRLSLPEQSGLLFRFAKPDIYQFWMPDMHFPIDIIWINDGQIIDISADVPNDFDPANPIYYKPSRPVRYVLEVNSGFSAEHDISIGDLVKFENISPNP